MYFNNKEEAIIAPFMNIADEYEGKILTLKWENGSKITAVYDTYIEDESDYELDDDNYEEYWTFVFKALDMTGKPPVYITDDEYFCINYHNFPAEIFAENKNII